MTRTRKVSAVKRRAVTASGARTQKVQAVKRAPWKALEKALYGVQRAKVLRRGALRNAAGKHDDGWQARAEDGEALFAFVCVPESGLKGLRRVFGKRLELVLDVMLGKQRVAGLVMHGKWTDTSGSGQLFDLEKNEIASVELFTLFRAKVTQGGHPTPLLTFNAAKQWTLAKAGKRQVGMIEVLQAGSLIPRVDGYGVRFAEDSSPFERLLTIAAIVLGDMHVLRPEHDEVRRERLHSLFGDE
jgi:hypothetical protein